MNFSAPNFLIYIIYSINKVRIYPLTNEF